MMILDDFEFEKRTFMHLQIRICPIAQTKTEQQQQCDNAAGKQQRRQRQATNATAAGNSGM